MSSPPIERPNTNAASKYNWFVYLLEVLVHDVCSNLREEVLTSDSG